MKAHETKTGGTSQLNLFVPVLQATLEMDLPEELRELLNCVNFWNQDGPKCYRINCEEGKKDRMMHNYKSWILGMIEKDCNAIIKGREEPLDYNFGKSGDHVWLHNNQNERILMFHF